LTPDREHILDIHIDKMASTIKAAVEEKPKQTEKEELEARKKEKEKESQATEELQKAKPRAKKLMEFESFKDEIIEVPT
jgi:beta-phosphoglucomutase-like phosphatase (HAD superfamily)